MARKDCMHFTSVENHESVHLSSVFWSGRRIYCHRCNKDRCVKRCDEPEYFVAPVRSLPSRGGAGGVTGRRLLWAAMTEGHPGWKCETGNIQKTVF